MIALWIHVEKHVRYVQKGISHRKNYGIDHTTERFIAYMGSDGYVREN